MSGDTIYVAGLPPEVTEQEIAEYFGQAGVVRTDKQTGLPLVWIYKDIKTGLPKGDAIVSFEDTYTAAAAIQWFHQKPMRGSIIHASFAGLGSTELSVPSIPAAMPIMAPPMNETTAPVQTETTWQPAMDSVYPSAEYIPVDPQTTSGVMNHVQNKETWDEEHDVQQNQQQTKTDALRGRGKKITAAPQGPSRLFGPDDWPCPSCGNTNWARRSRCNLCGAPKPGTLDMKREGQAGGFKELDEGEIEAGRQRRKALEDADDGELYDDYGRVKKKYRNMIDKKTREEAALARLRGSYDPSPSGQELAMLLKRDTGKAKDEEGKESEIQESDGADDSEQRVGDASNDRPLDSKEEGKHISSKEREKERSVSPNRSGRRIRRRSLSPRYKGRRHRSPTNDRDSDRVRKTESRYRSGDHEDHYRRR